MRGLINLIESVSVMIPSQDETDYYMTEGCGIFALALSTALPGGNIEILSRKYGEEFSRTIPYEVTHVFYRVDGKTVDCRGNRSVGDMASDFNCEDFTIRYPENIAEFKKRFVGSQDNKPLFGGNSEIKEAIELINRYADFYGIKAPTE
jgi:hypothetical protein